MPRTGPVERAEAPAGGRDRPLLRLLAQGALLELLWGVGLLALLGFVSVAISALLSTLGRI